MERTRLPNVYCFDTATSSPPARPLPFSSFFILRSAFCVLNEKSLPLGEAFSRTAFGDEKRYFFAAVAGAAATASLKRFTTVSVMSTASAA